MLGRTGRWSISDPWLLLYLVGWMPLCALGQVLTADGWRSVGWGMWLVLGVWFGPLVVAVLGLWARALVAQWPPIQLNDLPADRSGEHSEREH